MVVTMRDVAKEAGVSPASVSFALRGDPRIKQETAQHIIEVANRMNYSVNATAKSLRSGRTGVIEAAVYQVDRPFYAQLLAGISSAALRAGVQAVVQQISYGKAGNEKNILEKVANQFCDGVILSAGGLSDAEIMELSKGKPVVLLDDQSYQGPFDSVFTPWRTVRKPPSLICLIWVVAISVSLERISCRSSKRANRCAWAIAV